MAAPSVSGLTTLRSVDFSADGTNLSISGGSATIVNRTTTGFQIGAGSNNVNYKLYVGFNSTGTLDFTNRELYLAGTFNLNISSTSPSFSIGLRDTSDRDRIYRVSTDQNFKFQINNYLLSFNNGLGTYTEDAGFDVTNVKGMVFHLRFGNVTSWPNGNQAGFVFNQIGYIDSINGLTLTGGEVGDLANIDDIISYYGTISAVDNVTYGLYKDLILEYLLGFTSLTISNATLANTGGAIVFRGIRNSLNQSWLTYPSRTITVNNSSRQIIGFQIKSAASFAFRDIGAANTYQGIPIAGYTEALLGSSDYRRVELSGSGAAIGGGELVACVFSDSTATYAYQWNGTASFENCEFSGTQDFFINFEGADFADGATFDATGITFSGTPTTNIFRLNAAGKTLNITVAPGSGLTNSDVTVIAGTVNVALAPASLSAPNFANGVRFFAARQQTFAIQSADINVSENLITLGNDNETGDTFAGQITSPATLALLTLATGATIPTSSPQIVDGNLYYVIANTSGVIQISEIESGSAINFTNAGTHNGSGELFSLRCETQILNQVVSGGTGVSQALTLPNNALINVAAIHRASASSCSTLFERQLQWSAATGATIPDTFSATNNPDAIHNALVGATIRSRSGLSVSVTSDGATVTGLSFDLSGNIELDANAITDNTISFPDGYLWAKAMQASEMGIRFIRNQFTAVGIMDFRFNKLRLDNVADGVRNSPATTLTVYGNVEPGVSGDSIIASGSGTVHIIPFYVADIESTAGGGSINAQDVADALKLAPTAGSPAAGSVYAELDSLLAGSGGSLSYDLPQFIALMRADSAFKRALSDGSLIAGLADELALVKTQVWTQASVRTAWNTLITNAGVTDPSVGEIAAWNGYAALLPGLTFASNGVVSYAG